MKILTKTRLGLQILLQVGRAGDRGDLVPGRILAGSQGLNEPYLEQIVMQMRRAGLLASTRGRRGGYRLARPAAEITLLDILESFEGPLDLSAPPPDPDVRVSPEAETADSAWERLGTAVAKNAAAVTLAHLLDRTSRCRDYQI